ncbi:MAG TPA: O-antigen ligase domain-containing protein [Chloroflexi bacterium]|mgnify:CR=1 FL=1|nr:O-antigen ligase domain-containing protein [Chloroflexota bacterium]
MKRFKFLQNETAYILFWSILVGFGLGVLSLVAQNVSSKWVIVIVGTVFAPIIVLLVKDIKKLILISFIVDSLLGIDIAIQNKGWHRGGPTGFLVSLMTIGLIVGYALWIIEKKPKPRFCLVTTVPGLLILLTVALSFYNSPYWQLSAFGLFLKAQAFLMYFYVINHVTTWQDRRLVLIILIICLLLQGSLMILQYFSGTSLNIGGLITSESMAMGGEGVVGDRVSGTLVRPGNAALYLNSLISIMLGLMFADSLLTEWFPWIVMAAIVGIMALLFTSSRGGWIAFAISMIIVIGRGLWIKQGRKAIFIFLVLMAVFLLIFGGQVKERLVTIEEDRSREWLDTMAYNIIRAYPFGIGENTYDLYMSDRYAHPAMVGHTHLPVHNRYLMIWAETGLHGLIAFILLLAAPFWQAREWFFNTQADPDRVALGVGLLGGLTSQIVHMRSENFYGLHQTTLLWFLIAMIVSVNQNGRD